MKVSVITPTANRPELLKRCIEQFLAQNWQDKEMIICYNDSDVKQYLGLEFDNIFEWSMPDNTTIGAKLNFLCEYGIGDIIIRMDSDDIYSPDWITKSVNHLIQSGAEMTGLKNAYFYDETRDKAYEYHYSGSQPCLLGATMCYWKSTWDRTTKMEIPKGPGKGMETIEFHGFPDYSNGEDTLFCFNKKIIPHTFKDNFVAIQHGLNTTGIKKFSGSDFKPANVNYVRELVSKLQQPV